MFPEGLAYSLGVLQQDTPVGTWYGHHGQIFGYSDWVLYAPDLDAALVVLVNADAPAVDLGGVIMALAQTTGSD
jgi:hypothetical protein